MLWICVLCQPDLATPILTGLLKYENNYHHLYEGIDIKHIVI